MGTCQSKRNKSKRDSLQVMIGVTNDAELGRRYKRGDELPPGYGTYRPSSLDEFLDSMEVLPSAYSSFTSSKNSDISHDLPPDDYRHNLCPPRERLTFRRSLTDGAPLGDGTCESKDKKKTSKLLSFAKLFTTISLVSLATTSTTNNTEKQSDKDSSGRTSRSVSLRRALSHRSSSSASYFTTQKRRDSLHLIYKKSDNGNAYKPPIPHPLLFIAKAA